MKLVDPMDFSIDPMLSNMQGNIIKGHGRDHTTHIFICFRIGKEKKAKQWIRNLAEEHITSCKKQLKERELYKRNKTDGDTFMSLFLSSEGYRYLGYANVNTKLTDEGFKAGMQKRINQNHDPAVEKWETAFQQEIHAMLLIADDQVNRMGLAAKEMLESITDFSTVCGIEYGNAIRNANKDGLEHFGYVDGISQPLFLKDEVQAYMSFHSIKEDNKNPDDPFAAAKFNPAADTALVLIPDPFAPKEQKASCFGSYFVFRKLEQNVKEFKHAEEVLGKKMFPQKEDAEKREVAGAYIVGRFEDGTPVAMDDEEGMIGAGNFNNFNYDDDPSGGRCPHFAHIRKTNPRKDFIPNDDHKSHIMARRGIPFGHRNVDTAIEPCNLQMPENGVGLLFMSYQASIKKQFEFIQQSWANNPSFPPGIPANETGVDLIIGHPHIPDGEPLRKYNFPLPYGSSKKIEATMQQFVTMKGGEYFFAPSIYFLKTLPE